MALKNNIAKTPQKDMGVTEYKVGEESIRLSPAIVRKYLVNGSGNVTDQEIMMFIGLCKYQHLNPFLREAYLIKYGNQPATIVTGKEAITKRAMRNQRFCGQKAGVVIYHEDTGELEYREGSLVIPGEQLVGGWARVYVKGFEVPIEAAVSFEEYVGRKGDGSINGQWAKKPATMIRKVALMQALREAFPEELGSMYASEEMGLDFDEEKVATVAQPEAQVQPEPIAEVIEHPEPVKQPQQAVQTPEQAIAEGIDGMF